MIIALRIPTRDKRRAALWVQQLMELAIAIAREEIRAGKVPALYRSGVRYIRQPPGVQGFAAPSAVHKRGGGDCKHLSVWRIAELREAGEENAGPQVMWRRAADGLRAHARVRRADGTIEDPSLALGMRK